MYLCRGPVNVSEAVIAPPAAVWTNDPAAAADDLSKRGTEQLTALLAHELKDHGYRHDLLN